MKNFELLCCFLLCVLPCVFTHHPTSEEELVGLATSMAITRQDLQECLDKVSTDWDTMAELSDSVLGMNELPSQDTVTKVSCFGACIYKKNGMMANSKIMPERVIEIISRVNQRPSVMPVLTTKIRECSARVPSKLDDCEVTLSFSRCVVDEMSRSG